MRRIPYAWRMVGLLWIVGLLNYVDRQVIFSVLPLLRADLHVSDLQIGFLGTAFLWTYALLSPLSGFVADRFGRRRIILVSFLVWTVVTCLTGFATNGTQLLFLRALMGISESCYVPAAVALIADQHGDRTRSLATGIHQSGLYFGIVVGGGIGGWVGQHYGWRIVFLALGFTGIAFWLVLSSGLKQPSNSAREVPLNIFSSTRELFALPRFRLLFAAFGLYSVVPWTVYTWFPLYLYERFSFSLAMAGFYATACIQSGSIAGTMVGGLTADRWRRRTVQGTVLTQILGVLVAAPFLILGVASTGRSLMVWSLVFFGLGRAFYETNVMPSLCQVVKPELRSTAMGLLNMVGCLSGGAMTAVAGALKHDLGLARAFQVVALLLVGVAALLWRVRMTDKNTVRGVDNPVSQATTLIWEKPS